MEKRMIDIAIAGLLHDIGKVVQRAQEDPWKPPEGHLLEGQPVHAKWTEYFIQYSVPQAYRPAALQGVYHHQPEKSPAADHSISNLIALADKLSAGERADEAPEGKGSQLPRQLVTIFDRVGTFRGKKDLPHHYLPLAELRLDQKAIFPTPVLDAKATVDAYGTLQKSFEAISRPMIDNPETYLENLQAGMQRYTWCIPSAYYHNLPDVSLYDHSRMTAALAVCMAERAGDEVERLLAAVRATFAEKATPADAELLSQPAAILVGGDISGIQKFLYTLSARKAAQTLRGRSFYLQLLTEAVLRFLLRELGLPGVNVIYSGGGHFYLLAPLSAADRLPDLQRRISEVMLKHHGAGLYFGLGWTKVPFSGFKRGAFPLYWDQMHAELSAIKLHRYQEFGGEFYTRIFEPIAHGGNQEATCAVCGEEKPGTTALFDQDDAEETRVCPQCKSFIDPLGIRLPDAAYVQLTFGQPIPQNATTALDALAEFGMGVQFFDKDCQPLSGLNGLTGAERAVQWALSDVTKWPDSKGIPVARTLHYSVNQVPRETFDDLQEKIKWHSPAGCPAHGCGQPGQPVQGRLWKWQ